MQQRPSRCGANSLAARRRWLQCAWVIAAWPFACHNARALGYPVTVAAMRAAQESEMAVYYRYSEFARKAKQEGYLGIAYLFVAFGSAEMIHATNFGRIWYA